MKNKKQIFEMPEFDGCNKHLELLATDGSIRLLIDFDDVNHYVVEELTKIIVYKLNEIPKDEWKTAIKLGEKLQQQEWDVE